MALVKPPQAGYLRFTVLHHVLLLVRSFLLKMRCQLRKSNSSHAHVVPMLPTLLYIKRRDTCKNLQNVLVDTPAVPQSMYLSRLR